ncbi:MAG TPA: TonB-dependent receptor [Sphingopyxis sp.]|uniref:TonB-dependent receptor n=1 Tax=Sphingopyxis sp. TaxID=1908224 RepID=UPI002C8846FE|nr:TonB-dependent receptor [Sphingopyxis sp.]HWW58367.1 TonB-dependent receptor [Sphingopyxis sp.]
MTKFRFAAVSTFVLAAALGGAPAFAQDSAAPPVAAEAGDDGVIVVTARKRDETLADVPIAVTAIDGDTLTARGLNSVREAAVLSPGLNINSDGTGRAFVSIRGVGVTLVQSVQPGVGLFIDGIYQPNTAYLNNPLVDVERIEVLRGPQGTLYGKNTMGGAINVITRQPGNDFEVRANASYAGPDDAWMVSGSVSGPIVTDKVALRVAAAHRQQDGFLRNSVIGGNANPFNTDSINATLRVTPSEDFTLTIKGYYDWVDGVNTPYARVTGPTDYSRVVQFNTLNAVSYKYRGINLRAEGDLGGGSKLSVIGAYDMRNGFTPDGEGDFGPADIVRTVARDSLRTMTLESRLDSEWSDQFSTLLGVFYSNEMVQAQSRDTISLVIPDVGPVSVVRDTRAKNVADTYAAFGTLFWKPNLDWEVALGLRYDHEDRVANGSVSGALVPTARIKSDEWQPKLSITRKWTPGLMTYVSVARGYRGGGFNAPTAPTRTYRGDSAWTYEAGAKYSSPVLNLSGSVFYSDYKDYIGLNSIAPAAGGGLVTVDLNSGDVESYGVELEAMVRPVRAWTLRGAFTWMHARITDDSAYFETTGRQLSSDRLTFQPDWTASFASDYRIETGGDSDVTLSAGLVGKGKRLAATLNETTPTVLDSYWLTNASIAYRTGPVEVALFANNIFNTEYFESYIEQTTLALAGLPASDLGITGDRRRYGVRASLKF